MKVILLVDVKGQGKKGQLIDASDGYARNFLLPRKLAQPATTDALNAMKIAEAAHIRHVAEEKKAAQELKTHLEGIQVKIYAKSGGAGKLFGAVTTKEIAEALQKQFDIDIPKTKLTIDEPIKHFGTFEIKAKLHADVAGIVYIVVAEGA